MNQNREGGNEVEESRDLNLDAFVGIAEAASVMGVSAATLRRMASRNEIRCYRLGRTGHRRFRKRDLLSALEAGSNKAPVTGSESQKSVAI